MTIELSLNGVNVSNLALDAEFKTKNTEMLSIICAKLIGQMAAAGMKLDDGQFSPAEIDAVWAKQSAMLTWQKKYIAEVSAFFNKKSKQIPSSASMLGDFLRDLAAWLAGKAAAAYAKKLGPLADVVDQIVNYGVVYAIDKLRELFQEGVQLCDAMQAENDGLLALPPSRKNYELRSMVITQHDQTVANLLAHAAQLEAQIAASGVGDDEEWQDWIGDMDEAADDIEKWIDDGVAAEVSMLDAEAANDLPVPIAPKLPAVPFPKLPSKRNELPAIIIGQLVKVGGKALLKYLKKSMDRKTVMRQGDLIDAIRALQSTQTEMEAGDVRIVTGLHGPVIMDN